MLYIIAQCVGFLGYLFYISAPQCHEKTKIIAIDSIALVLLCTQWVLLSQPTLITLTILNLGVSIYVLSKSHQSKYAISYIYAIGCTAIITVSILFPSSLHIDSLCLMAFFCLVGAKTSDDIVIFRTLSAVTGTLCAIAALAAFSVPAFLFNVAFTFIHVIKVTAHNSTDKMTAFSGS